MARVNHENQETDRQWQAEQSEREKASARYQLEHDVAAFCNGKSPEKDEEDMMNPQFMVHHYLEVDKYADESEIDKKVRELQAEEDYETGLGHPEGGSLYDGKATTEQRTPNDYVNQWFRPSLAYTVNTTIATAMEGVRRSPRVETQQANKSVRFNISPTIARLQRTSIPRRSTAAVAAASRASPPPLDAAIKTAAKKKGRPAGGADM